MNIPLSTLVTGATGFVGKRLIQQLAHPIVCSRNQAAAMKKLDLPESQVIQWNPSEGTLSIDQPVQQVVNLMGESIAHGRWNDSKKKRIRDSRIQGTRNLVDGLLQTESLPDVFVSASAIGFYGDPGESIVDEDFAQGTGFLPDVCAAWEDEALRLQDHGVRVVCLRIGIVLGPDGGAVKEMAPIFKWCVGGRLGTGKQWMAWIHVNDLVSLIMYSLATPSLMGPVNATAPNPVRNSEFTRAMASAVGRPAIFPAPKFALKLALGEFAESLFFSQRVIPKAATDAGFEFEYSDVHQAVADCLSPPE